MQVEPSPLEDRRSLKKPSHKKRGRRQASLVEREIRGKKRRMNARQAQAARAKQDKDWDMGLVRMRLV